METNFLWQMGWCENLILHSEPIINRAFVSLFVSQMHYEEAGRGAIFRTIDRKQDINGQISSLWNWDIRQMLP